jgi:amino acid adenylation domain-containing protein
MKSIETFLSNLSDRDIKLWVETSSESSSDNVRLRCNAPKEALTPELREQLTERKSEIIAFLRRSTLGTDPTLETIPLRPRQTDLPLSFAQARLWFLNHLEGESATYNIPMAFALTGDLNVVALEKSVQTIVERHEVLRTTFELANDTPIQVIHEVAHLNIPVIDLQSLPTAEQNSRVQQFVTEAAQRSFNLSKDSLLRVTLLRLAEQSHVLMVTMHHIISDGWSMGIFLQELSLLYRAFGANEPSPLAPLSIQYADFAHWQRQWLQGEVLERQINYWKQKLAGAPPLLELPTDRPRPAMQRFRGQSTPFHLSTDVTQPLKAFSQRSGTTLFMTLFTAFATLLYRYSGQEDIVIGSPIANRNRSQIEPLIGFFTNTLALRTQFHGNPSFSQLLEQVQRTTLEAYDHQDLPFEKLVEELKPERSLSYSPLFQVMFVLENGPDRALNLPGLTLTSLETKNVSAKFDLMLSLAETETGLQGNWDYNSDLFDHSTIERMVGHFQTLLSSIVANPDQLIAQIPLLTAAEQQQMLIEWNHTQVDYPLDQCFPQLFEAQVQRTPDAIAAVYQNQQFTYQQLNDRANQWATVLVQQGIGSETLVALLEERNLNFLTAMLAVFKAGGAYLPLNPQHPSDRIAQVLQQSQVPFLLSSQRWQSLVETLDTCPQTLWVERLDSAPGCVDNLPVRCSPDSLAYVIYTSGSTGTPKGAMLEHRGMLNHLLAKVDALQLSATDRVAQTAAQTFDISIWQFLCPLLVGGRVEIVPQSMVSDPAQLLSLVEQRSISILEVVPSLLLMLLQHLELTGVKISLKALRWLLLTGEALPPALCQQWFEIYPEIPLLNAYGPTECSDDVTHHLLHQSPQSDWFTIPIGYPLPNTQLYVLDSWLQPVPIGVAGELYVGGAGVGRGYLHSEMLTSKAFIPHPLVPGQRLYKTGDKVRFRADGSIEFLGRLDHQVKLRGFRIELGEIETILCQHPEVQAAVVLVREDQPGQFQLVAYVVADSTADVAPQSLRQFLQKKLPDYMLPQAFVRLDALPLTANGKVDRKALPIPEVSVRTDFAGPRDALELQLMQIWEEVLQVQSIGIRDNFFDLGGHSLLAVSLMARIQQQFGKKLSLAMLFQSPTIAQLATLLQQEGESSSSSTLVALQSGSSHKRPLFCVHPGGGTVLAYLALARHLDPDQPVYGLESLDLDEHQTLHTTVPGMAAYYLEVMRSIQPQGPYRICGWSFGGLVALEIAQQLQAQGQQVDLLALLDTYPFNEYEELNEADDRIFLEQLLAQNNGAILGIPPELDVEQAQRLLQVFKSHILAANDYIAQPYAGKVTLFLAEHGVEVESQTLTQAWEALAKGGLEIHQIPGDHHMMVRSPNVEVLAAKLQRCLEQA